MLLLVSRLIRQPRYEAAMTEAPAAIANLCRERPTAELAGLEVCIPRRRDNLATPRSIFEIRVRRDSTTSEHDTAKPTPAGDR